MRQWAAAIPGWREWLKYGGLLILSHVSWAYVTGPMLVLWYYWTVARVLGTPVSFNF